MNNTRTKGIYIGSGILVLGIAVVALFVAFNHDASEPSVGGVTSGPTPDPRVPSLSGQLLDPEVANRTPIVVMVENHPDARPQTGLSKAEVVYETVAEGGITRYVAVFQQSVELVGPVRSARDYFADVANTFGGVYAHVGGSPEVLASLNNGVYKNLADLNEFTQGQYFFRDPKRLAPHNAYARMDVITEKVLGAAPRASGVPFEFGDSGQTDAGELATDVAVDFSLPSYKVRFAYDAATRTYTRFVGGKQDVDTLGSVPLAPRTIVVEEVSVAPVPGDEKLRVDVGVVGKGTAYFFQRGTVVKGTWSRERGKAAKYTDTKGAALMFEAGQIWVMGVPADGVERVTWSVN